MLKKSSQISHCWVLVRAVAVLSRSFPALCAFCQWLCIAVLSECFFPPRFFFQLSHKSIDNAAIFSAQGGELLHSRLSLQGEGWRSRGSINKSEIFLCASKSARSMDYVSWLFIHPGIHGAATVEIECSFVRLIPGPCGLQESLRTIPNPNQTALCICALLTYWGWG